MFPVEIDYRARQERCKDLQREAAREQLIHEAEFQQPDHSEPHRKIIGWFGAQMVKWGSKEKGWGHLSLP